MLYGEAPRERLRGPQLSGFALDPPHHRSGYRSSTPAPGTLLGEWETPPHPAPRPMNFAGGSRSGSGVWFNLTRALHRGDERSGSLFLTMRFRGPLRAEESDRLRRD